MLSSLFLCLACRCSLGMSWSPKASELLGVSLTLWWSTISLLGKLPKFRLGHGFHSELLVITRLGTCFFPMPCRQGTKCLMWTFSISCALRLKMKTGDDGNDWNFSQWTKHAESWQLSGIIQEWDESCMYYVVLTNSREFPTDRECQIIDSSRIYVEILFNIS